jgi:hypothetical protein
MHQNAMLDFIHITPLFAIISQNRSKRKKHNIVFFAPQDNIDDKYGNNIQ